MTFSYDEDDDVLYVTFARPETGVRYLETERGDVIRFCKETNGIVGLTVLFYADRSRRGESIEFPEIGVVAFSPAMNALVNVGHAGRLPA